MRCVRRLFSVPLFPISCRCLQRRPLICCIWSFVDASAGELTRRTHLIGMSLHRSSVRPPPFLGDAPKTILTLEKTIQPTVFSKVRIVFSKVRTVFSVPSFVFPHLFAVFSFCLPKDIPAGGAEGWPRGGNWERLSRARQEKCRERQQTCTEFYRNFPAGDSRFR